MSQRRSSSRAQLSDEARTELDGLREAIDAVDRRILAQLNERAELVISVGEIKQRSLTPIYAAARERDIVSGLAAENQGPFPNSGLPHVFREIISATRSLEETVRVAYLGPEGTFSHQAARKTFGALADFRAMPSIPEVFEAVEKGVADAGIVPIENTTEGVVTVTLDTFAESELAACGETLLHVSHDLMSVSGRLEDVKRVVSHPQPLAQCRTWLDRNLPGIPRVQSPSTAEAARQAGEEPDLAAIGSSIATEVYALRTVQASIEDRRDNSTRFVVIGRDAPPASGNDLTSVVFTVRKAESGALFRLLEPFSRNGVNLTSIQSRPIKGKPWEYLFLIDLEGHRDDPPVAHALEEAGKRAHSHHVLGSFPRALASGEAAKSRSTS